jgi:hypothetical protein
MAGHGFGGSLPDADLVINVRCVDGQQVVKIVSGKINP